MKHILLIFTLLLTSHCLQAQGLSLSMTTICEGIETEYQIEAKNKEELIDKIIQTLNLE